MADYPYTYLRELLFAEWQRNHDRECLGKYPHQKDEECSYPILEVLIISEGKDICLECGGPYTKKRPWHMFCDNICRVNNWKRVNKVNSNVEDTYI